MAKEPGIDPALAPKHQNFRDRAEIVETSPGARRLTAMQSVVAICLVICAGLFIGSEVSFVARQIGVRSSAGDGFIADLPLGDSMHRLFSDEPEFLAGGLTGLLHDPDSIVLMLLSIFVWLAVLGYVLRVTGTLQRLIDEPQSATPRDLSERTAPMEPPLLIAGLIAGALWPWIGAERPVLGFLVAALMFVGMTGAALSRLGGGKGMAPSTSLGMLAGWATIEISAALATLLYQTLGIPQTAAALLALLVCAMAAVWTQLKIGAPFAYSLTVTWGLLGIAIATMADNITIASATAIAMTVVGLALVRVTT